MTKTDGQRLSDLGEELLHIDDQLRAKGSSLAAQLGVMVKHQTGDVLQPLPPFEDEPAEDAKA